MAGSEAVKVSVATALIGLTACVSGGCAEIVGADWGEYERCEDTGGVAATGVSGGECCPEEIRCLNDRPQRCNERGQWENKDKCPEHRPICNGGTCTGLSCRDLPATCGPTGKESCCASALVLGGTFDRINDTNFPATVSDFQLDRFEVTVGRFRRFVEAYPASRPTAGAGAHPRIAGSGWDPGFDSALKANAADLAAVSCGREYRTWTDDVRSDENLPINCVTWYEAFAFCAWDGGRLPTELELNYAAAGGREQRRYPWSEPADSEAIDDSLALYLCTGDGSNANECAFSDILPAGSRSPKGDGVWGQADLAGSMWEWVLDSDAEYPEECNDCGSLTGSSERVLRGGAWKDNYHKLAVSHRESYNPSDPWHDFGIRCARE
ncbi:formylglycine-generating enzyme family protein [Sorangium sp. So ce1335]|uniref:formylglycine-generating enzyme family protein n=1 Tax=Sorangium sp. So ce1335 TaxID=3133335 RepID=UPI003F5F5211